LGVEVVQVSPSTVPVVFVKSATRTVPVKPAIDGRPQPGYVIRAVTASPANVEIVGPESAVRRATEALTEPVSVAGARDRVREVATVGTLDSAVRVRTQRTATVTVDIVPAPLERTLRDRPVLLRNLSQGLTATAEPSVVDVTLRGERNALSALQSDDAVAFVDLAGYGAGEYTVTVRADTTRDAGITRVDPPSVKVRIAGASN
jgi:YbbR domain-containing protein